MENNIILMEYNDVFMENKDMYMENTIMCMENIDMFMGFFELIMENSAGCPYLPGPVRAGMNRKQDRTGLDGACRGWSGLVGDMNVPISGTA